MRSRTVLAALIAIISVGSVGLAVAQSHGAGPALSAQDYIDIQQLYARYAQTIDRGDAEGWANTFTPDGVFNNSSRGHDALVQFIHDWRDKRDGANRRHWNSNLVITPSSTGANGSVYLLLMNTGARPPVPAASYIYEDTLVKTPAGWRFKTRVLHPDTPVAPAATTR